MTKIMKKHSHGDVLGLFLSYKCTFIQFNYNQLLFFETSLILLLTARIHEKIDFSIEFIFL